MLQDSKTASPDSYGDESFFERVQLPIGLALYCLSDHARQDLGSALACAAEIGYRDIEVPSLFGRSPGDVRASADQAGLTISSMLLSFRPETQIPGSPVSLASSVHELAD